MSDPDIGGAAFGWWREALGDTGRGRANRAQLRRVSSAVDAIQIETLHDLHHALGGDLGDRGETLALIAVALANIRETVPQTAPERMEGKVSPLRFQRLVRIAEPADLIVPLRRALSQIDCTANVPTLARDLFRWSDRTRNDWCFAYYGARFAAPGQPEETEA